MGPNSYFVFFQDRSSKSFENSTIKERQERQDGSRSWVYMAPESLEVFYFPVAYGACFFLNWDGSSMNQLPAVFVGVQYAFLGFKPSSIETTSMGNIIFQAAFHML